MAVSLVGCSKRNVRASAPAPPATGAPATYPEPVPVKPGMPLEQGLASWYGVPFHGRRTASGETYDMHQLTAAHRTLPFGTLVRVTNLRNGRKTEVRINDRGPFIEDRVIDLSLGAARALDMVARGVVPVRLEVIAAPPDVSGYFSVQVGAFLVRDNALRLRQRLETRYQPVFIREWDSPEGLFYRVYVGRVSSGEAARSLAARLRDREQLSSLVIRLEQ